MDRIFSKGTLLVLGIMALAIFFSTRFSKCSGEPGIRASVYPKEVFLGDPIFFSDSTVGQNSVVWEFGNGDFTSDRRGSYTYPAVGNYKIRLRMGTQSQSFVVSVKEVKKEKERQSVRIIAPSTVVRNEVVALMGEGEASSWHWKLRSVGLEDSKERNPLVRFDTVGDFQIGLVTDNMEYPIFHKIRVVPDVITFDSTAKPQDVLKKHLQSIIDQTGSYNGHYNAVLRILKGNNLMDVVVNNEIEEDISSYCNRLKIMGKQNGLFIESVVIEMDVDDKRIKRVLVSQKQIK